MYFTMWRNKLRGEGLRSPSASLVPLETEVQLKIDIQFSNKPSTQHPAIYQRVIHTVAQRDVSQHMLTPKVLGTHLFPIPTMKR